MRTLSTISPSKTLTRLCFGGQRKPLLTLPELFEGASIFPVGRGQLFFGELDYLAFYGSLARYIIFYRSNASTEKSPDGKGPTFKDGRCQLSGWHQREAFNQNQSARFRKFAPSLYVALAVKEGCVSNISSLFSVEDLSNMSFEQIATKIRDRWTDYGDFWQEAFHERPRDMCDWKSTCTSRLRLAAQAQTASVRLMVHPRHASWCHEHDNAYNIISPDGTLIGFLAPSPTLQDPFLRSQFSSLSFKAMALSISSCSGFDCDTIQSRPVHGDEMPDASYTDCNGKSLYHVPVVNVMLLGEKDETFFRHSIGRVILRHWAELDRQFETLVLS